MKLTLILKLLFDAIERENKQKAWDMWLSKYPQMTKDNFVQFSKFYEELTIPQTSHSVSGESIKDIYDKFNPGGNKSESN